VQHLKSDLLALFLSFSLIVSIGTGAAAWEQDGSSYYWDRNGAGNRDELRTLYQNNRDDYSRLRDQYPDEPPVSVPPSYRDDNPQPPSYAPPSSPSMWDQFGPDGKFMTCQRSFNTVYCN
jgi:hypothetical protein